MERRDIASQAVTPESDSVEALKNSRFPERVGRIKPEDSFGIPTASEIATTLDAAGQPVVDRVVLSSVSSMDERPSY